MGLRKGASSGTLPRDTRPHCGGASPGSRAGEGCCSGSCCWAWGWGCCGRPLIPCPILECYSVTYNRVTRAASDVPNASIGHRNKEGRVPGSELYNPEFRDALIGSEVPGWEGSGGRGSCTAPRNPIAVMSGAGTFVQGTKTEFPQGSWHCEGLQLGGAEKSSHLRSDPEVEEDSSSEHHPLRKAGSSHLPRQGVMGGSSKGCPHEGTKLNLFLISHYKFPQTNKGAQSWTL